MSQLRTVADVLSALPSGGSVLVTGASSETLGRLPYRLLRAATDARDGALLVTTDDPAERLVQRFADRSDGPHSARVGVVDATPCGYRRADAEEGVWYASSPVDFNGTGVGVDRCYQHLEQTGAATVNMLYDTLTTPFLSADSSTAFRFSHHLTLQAAEHDGIELFPVHTNVTTDRDVARLKHLFDALVEVRKRGGDRQVRCSGVEGDWHDWYRLPDGDVESDSAGIV